MAKAKRPRRKPRPRTAVKLKPAQTDNVLGAPDGGLGLLELRKLIRLVQRTGIGELEISAGGRTVRISQHGTGPVTAVTAPASAHAAPAAPAPAAAAPAATATDHLIPITSPMVGTFYRAPAPDADPYVETGDTVEIGQTVCIVEAMKLMNEIESETRGRIVKILVENAQPVEFGQKLFLVEPV